MNTTASDSAVVLYYALKVRAARIPTIDAWNTLMFSVPIQLLCGAELPGQFLPDGNQTAPGNIYCLNCGEEHFNTHKQRILALPHCRSCWLTAKGFDWQASRLNYLYNYCKQPELLELTMANSHDLLQRALSKVAAPATPATATAPATQAAVPNELEDLQNIISDLQAQMQQQHPQIESYLTIIHKQMIQYPQLVHLLTDDQMATVVQSVLKQSDTILVKEKATKEKAAKKNQLALGQDW